MAQSSLWKVDETFVEFLDVVNYALGRLMQSQSVSHARTHSNQRSGKEKGHQFRQRHEISNNLEAYRNVYFSFYVLENCVLINWTVIIKWSHIKTYTFYRSV